MPDNTDTDANDLGERLAAIQHEIWSHWMRYLLSVCEHGDDGSYTIPAEFAERWNQQINTQYGDLSEKEKDSDRKQAAKVLAVFKSWQRQY